MTDDTVTATSGSRLPQLDAEMFIADGGLETALIFLDGIDLPEFAAFPLVTSDDGRQALHRYYANYLAVAERHGVGILLDTPTWRASLDWGAALGYDRNAMVAVNRDAVRYVRQVAARHPSIATVVNGAIGPRGDGYVVGESMSVDEAQEFHSLQTDAFKCADADMTTAVTMTYAEEAIGIARAAAAVDLPVAIGVTVETDGRLPSGQPLGEAIEAIDQASDGVAEYFMINCAHPTHFDHVLDSDTSWAHRVKSIRANASTMSHEELDNAEELDRGDPAVLAAHYVQLREMLPDLRVVGGCCGTDHEHIEAIIAALAR